MRYSMQEKKKRFDPFDLTITFENKRDVNLFCKLLEQVEHVDDSVHLNKSDFVSVLHNLKQEYDIL